MEVCAEILANIKNDKFICEAISLTDDEFERARKRFSNNICSIELDYYYQYCPKRYVSLNQSILKLRLFYISLVLQKKNC